MLFPAKHRSMIYLINYCWNTYSTCDQYETNKGRVLQIGSVRKEWASVVVQVELLQ